MEKKNVLGTSLQSCSLDPVTGYYRNGDCDHCASDSGQHTVCAQVNESFLIFSTDSSTLGPPFSLLALPIIFCCGPVKSFTPDVA